MGDAQMDGAQMGGAQTNGAQMDGARSDDPRDWDVGRLLSTAARLVEAEWNAFLAGHDLTHAGFLALHVLQDGEFSQREVAARCWVEEQTMSRVLDKLERSGFVTRTRAEADRRRLVVRHTTAGSRVYQRALRAQLSDRLLLDGLGAEALEVFRGHLVSLVARLHHDPDRPPNVIGGDGDVSR